ncbi:MAG: phosphate regulon sensor histidine kinase PhoR, partial [bacterium]
QQTARFSFSIQSLRQVSGVHVYKVSEKEVTGTYTEYNGQLIEYDAKITKGQLIVESINVEQDDLLKLRASDRRNQICNLIRTPGFVNFVRHKRFDEPVEMTSPHNKFQTLMFSGAVFDADDTVLVVRDITRLRKLEQIRKDFVANISHELRTPLTVLTGYIETLQDNVPPTQPGWSRALTQMSSQTTRLTNLASDLVLLSELESVDVKPNASQVDLNGILEQVVNDAMALSEGKHDIQLTDVDDDLSIKGVQKELYSAISNLVFNAIRHNPPETIIRLSATREANGDVAVTVADNGIGIDPKHLPRITERFYRVDSSRNSESGGTGLGLAIVKHVLARHQGRLDVESTPGEGSTFTCVFSQHAPQANKSGDHSAASNTSKAGLI